MMAVLVMAMPLHVFGDKIDKIVINGEEFKFDDTLSTEEIIDLSIKEANKNRINEKVNVSINGKNIDFDIKPFIDENGRTLAPVRFVSENLGATVDWNGENQEVSITKGDKAIKLVIDSNKALVDGETLELDTKAVLKDGRTFVPLAFISKTFDCNVDWDKDTRTVILTTNNVEPQETEVLEPTEDEDFIAPVFKIYPNNGINHYRYFSLELENWKDYDTSYEFKVESPSHPKLDTEYYFDEWNTKEWIHIEYNKFKPMHYIIREITNQHYLEPKKENPYIPNIGDEIEFKITIKNGEEVKTYTQTVTMQEMK